MAQNAFNLVVTIFLVNLIPSSGFADAPNWDKLDKLYRSASLVTIEEFRHPIPSAPSSDNSPGPDLSARAYDQLWIGYSVRKSNDQIEPFGFVMFQKGESKVYGFEYNLAGLPPQSDLAVSRSALAVYDGDQLVKDSKDNLFPLDVDLAKQAMYYVAHPFDLVIDGKPVHITARQLLLRKVFKPGSSSFALVGKLVCADPTGCQGAPEGTEMDYFYFDSFSTPYQETQKQLAQQQNLFPQAQKLQVGDIPGGTHRYTGTCKGYNPTALCLSSYAGNAVIAFYGEGNRVDCNDLTNPNWLKGKARPLSGGDIGFVLNSDSTLQAVRLRRLTSEGKETWALWSYYQYDYPGYDCPEITNFPPGTFPPPAPCTPSPPLHEQNEIYCLFTEVLNQPPTGNINHFRK